MAKLSTKQENMLAYIWRCIQERGRPPTIREFDSDGGFGSMGSVTYNLDQLEQSGFVTRDTGVSRGLQLTPKAEQLVGAVVDFLRVPLVGTIVAGVPVPIADENFSPFDFEDQIELPLSMLRARPRDQLFALRVQGDSMIDAMVNEDDIVILRKTTEVRKGQMVAAWLRERHETTLKHYFREGDRVRLMPANPQYDPIDVDARQVDIQGTVLLVLRQLG